MDGEVLGTAQDMMTRGMQEVRGHCGSTGQPSTLGAMWHLESFIAAESSNIFSSSGLILGPEVRWRELRKQNISQMLTGTEEVSKFFQRAQEEDRTVQFLKQYHGSGAGQRWREMDQC